MTHVGATAATALLSAIDTDISPARLTARDRAAGRPALFCFFFPACSPGNRPMNRRIRSSDHPCGWRALERRGAVAPRDSSNGQAGAEAW